MSAASYSLGDLVLVQWMGKDAEATIFLVSTYDRGRYLSEPQYRVEIEGVTGHPWYSQSEISDVVDA